MPFTNEYNLPDAWVTAVTGDKYSKGVADFSVTELQAPARLSTLKQRHWREITEDVADRVWALYSQGVHAVLRMGEQSPAERLMIDIEGYIVSGEPDRYCSKTKTLSDYKMTSFSRIKFGRAPQDVIDQLNMYAAIYRANGLEVEFAEAIFIIRDWNKRRAVASMARAIKNGTQPQYPQAPVVTIAVPLRPNARVLDFIKERITAHLSARIELPNCTSEERWEGRRCESYCPAAPFCTQYSELNNGACSPQIAQSSSEPIAGLGQYSSATAASTRDFFKIERSWDERRRRARRK